MGTQDLIALSIVCVVATTIFYKMFFAKEKLKTCGSCSQCSTECENTTPTTQTQIIFSVPTKKNPSKFVSSPS